MTRFEALCMALELAITAPTEGLSQEVLGIAEVIARDMTAEAIERAKQKVVKRLWVEKAWVL
jgi:hypothetical protein